MSKGKNGNYKIYPISNVDDALSVIGNLIIAVDSNLDRYVFYTEKLKSLIAELQASKSSRPTYITSVDFDAINDCLLYRQREILKYVADEQSSSFSYKNVRKYILKQGYLAKKLTDKDTQLLNEMLTLRNWSFHNAQSNYTASQQVAKNSIIPALKNHVAILPQLNPLIRYENDFYDISFLESLLVHNLLRISQFTAVLSLMKIDYEEMYKTKSQEGLLISNFGVMDTSKVNYLTIHNDKPQTVASADAAVADISMQIQKGSFSPSE